MTYHPGHRKRPRDLIRMAEVAKIIGFTHAAAVHWARRNDLVEQPTGRLLYVSLTRLAQAFPDLYQECLFRLDLDSDG